MAAQKFALLALSFMMYIWLVAPSSALLPAGFAAGFGRNGVPLIVPLAQRRGSADYSLHRPNEAAGHVEDAAFHKFTTMALACALGIVLGFSSSQPVHAADKKPEKITGWDPSLTADNPIQAFLCSIEPANCQTRAYYNYKNGIKEDKPKPPPKKEAPKPEAKTEEAPAAKAEAPAAKAEAPAAKAEAAPAATPTAAPAVAKQPDAAPAAAPAVAKQPDAAPAAVPAVAKQPEAAPAPAVTVAAAKAPPVTTLKPVLAAAPTPKASPVRSESYREHQEKSKYGAMALSGWQMAGFLVLCTAQVLGRGQRGA